MVSAHDIFFGLAAPALVGIVFFFVGWWRRAKVADIGAPAGRAVRTLSFALCTGFVCGYLGIQGMPRLPPTEAAQWLFFATLAMLLLVVIHRFAWHSRWFWNISSAILLGATIVAIIRPLAGHAWTTGETIGWTSGLWIVALAVSYTLNFASVPEFSVAVPIALTGISLAGAAVLGMSGSQTYGQLAATLPAILAPMTLLALITRTEPLDFTFGPIFVLLFGGLLLCGNLYAELTTLNAVLLFLSPLGIWIGRLPLLRRIKSWQRELVRFIVAMLPATVAFGLALHKFLADMAGQLPY